ncbi:hypothetical protein KM043_003040 [Ampulex compressa]|nr:hypothetical protein KM043_003040 [Ampulex compressa]
MALQPAERISAGSAVSPRARLRPLVRDITWARKNPSSYIVVSLHLVSRCRPVGQLCAIGFNEEHGHGGRNERGEVKFAKASFPKEELPGLRTIGNAYRRRNRRKRRKRRSSRERNIVPRRAMETRIGRCVRYFRDVRKIQLVSGGPLVAPYGTVSPLSFGERSEEVNTSATED